MSTRTSMRQVVRGSCWSLAATVLLANIILATGPPGARAPAVVMCMDIGLAMAAAATGVVIGLAVLAAWADKRAAARRQAVPTERAR